MRCFAISTFYESKSTLIITLIVSKEQIYTTHRNKVARFEPLFKSEHLRVIIHHKSFKGQFFPSFFADKSSCCFIAQAIS